jgi:hypothetical protein
MDPNAALMAMIQHMAEGERDGALDALDALRDWLIGGGFLPEKAARDLTEDAHRATIHRITAEVREKLDEIDASV